jgi:trimethylamine:corrinoid methyltransferase-like protein
MCPQASGTSPSFAKFMLDAEQMEMLWKLGQGPRFENLDEAVATIAEVGPGAGGGGGGGLG